MDVTKEMVIDAIRAAFAGVPRGAITLHEAEVIDGYGDDAERARARSLDQERRWEDVPDAAIEACPWALPHLDPVSWRYYVPAHMVWTLRHRATSTSLVGDFTIYAFESSAELAEHAAQRFRLLDPAQSRAVCLFLRYLAANEDQLGCDGDAARRALAQRWGRCCG